MRLYTVEIDKCQQMAIEGSGHRLYLLKDFGVKYEDMNELITSISNAELEEVKYKAGHSDFLDSLESYSPDEVHICAPIPELMQDVICQGINYDEHIKAFSVSNALSHVFGYMVINDVSARNIQFRHQQWYLGKSLDGFSPMGPCIVTADELPDVQNLSITCTVNGELRQSSNTSCMIQPVFLKPGDEIVCEIEKIGMLKNIVE